MAWRVAYSLNRLLDQFNALAPGRNKASDGSIGDTNHQNRTSDHNPWYGPGIVTARDFTHDPAKLSMHWVADTLTAHRDPRIKYIIWNRRIWNRSEGWKAYTGSNPHTSHLHLSVVASPACDSTAPWAGFITATPPKDNDMTPDEMLAAKMRFLDGRTVTMGTAVAETWQNSYDTLAMVRAFPTILEAATRDPDLTADAIAQIVRDNAPAPAPIDIEAVKQAVRDAAGEDNPALADAIADNLVTRLSN